MSYPKWPSIYWPTSSWLVYLKPSSVLIILASKCLSFNLWINNVKIFEKCAKKNFGVSFHYLVFVTFGKLILSWVSNFIKFRKIKKSGLQNVCLLLLDTYTNLMCFWATFLVNLFMKSGNLLFRWRCF